MILLIQLQVTERFLSPSETRVPRSSILLDTGINILIYLKVSCWFKLESIKFSCFLFHFLFFSFSFFFLCELLGFFLPLLWFVLIEREREISDGRPTILFFTGFIWWMLAKQREREGGGKEARRRREGGEKEAKREENIKWPISHGRNCLARDQNNCTTFYHSPFPSLPTSHTHTYAPQQQQQKFEQIKQRKWINKDFVSVYLIRFWRIEDPATFSIKSLKSDTRV